MQTGLTIAAIFLGPVIALWLQRWIDHQRETRNRKLSVFRTLMAYRATRIAPLFVQSLNLIDIEFTAKKESGIRDAWRELLDHLSDLGRKAPDRSLADYEREQERTNDLTAELLTRMGEKLGYKFDRVYAKKAAYHPQGLGDIENEQRQLRAMLINLLKGGSSLPVAVFEQTFPPMSTTDITRHAGA